VSPVAGAAVASRAVFGWENHGDGRCGAPPVRAAAAAAARSMGDALCYTNTCIEHEAKAVALRNEEGISGDDDKKTYRRIKEKVLKVLGTSLATLSGLIAEYEVSTFGTLLSQSRDLLSRLSAKPRMSAPYRRPRG
jgi:hypothetical protein